MWHSNVVNLIVLFITKCHSKQITSLWKMDACIVLLDRPSGHRPVCTMAYAC